MAWTERYVSVAGGGAHDGTTEADAWTLAEAIAAPYAAGQRLNVKAGTYANTTTSRTFNIAGTTTAPIWWRGYNTTIGDIDTNNVLTKPAITFTTGQFSITGSYQIFSHLDISGACATQQVNLNTGSRIALDRCRVENTNATANGSAVRVNAASDGVTLSRSWFKATTTASSVAITESRMAVTGCVFTGGGNGITHSSGNSFLVANSTFWDNGVDGIDLVSGVSMLVFIDSCTFYSPGADGVNIRTTAPMLMVIQNCIFSNCAGYGINQATGANTTHITRLHNLFYSNTSGPETGFGDWPSIAEQADSSSPFTNAAGGDLSLVGSSNARANGIPGTFENQSYTSYTDVGAVQRYEPTDAEVAAAVWNYGNRTLTA